jgi:Flp pilus assembly pilin Flp
MLLGKSPIHKISRVAGLRNMMKILHKIIRDQQGAIFAEYAMLAALIAAACVAAVTILGLRVADLFSGVF